MEDKRRLDEILARLRRAEEELEQELDRLLEEKRRRFRYTLRQGRVVFERGIRGWQRQQRMAIWRYLRTAPLLFILSAPVIYALIVPLVLLDVAVMLYQQICFRIYGIPLVRRRDYLVVDRHALAYLNAIEKFNCVYCGYSNGLIAYVREVAGRTEQFWCPIKHARRVRDAHRHMEKFFDYGDAEAWRTRLAELRRDWEQDFRDD
ncbi:MAG TPA: hypothetical protein ENK27_03140 [Desulfobulbus sp.]|nr:hypothetical protein [Desulfobulbus sp.]